MDLSYRAASMLGYVNNGHAQIAVQYVGRAPLEGDDTRMLVASYDGPNDYDRGTTRMASNDGTNSMADMAGNFFGSLFSYADTTPEKQDLAIETAHAAVDAMATRSPALQDWVESTDLDARDIKLGLGVFTDQQNAIELSERFAFLGAVDEEAVTVNGRQATRLTLTHLKPGVARTDALDLARELGLSDIILY
jgi:rare lipoprotein A